MPRLPAGTDRLRARIAAALRPDPAAPRSKGALGARAFTPAPRPAAVTPGRSPAGGSDEVTGRSLERLGRDDPGRTVRWVPVRSSWILALRFVPTGREGNRQYADGYVDMMVQYQRRCYRYGPVPAGQRSFNRWVVAASRGKWWWRYWTRRWSPARRFA